MRCHFWPQYRVTHSFRPLVIIAEDIDNEALSALVYNRIRSQLQIVAVKAPGFGDNRKSTLQVGKKSHGIFQLKENLLRIWLWPLAATYLVPRATMPTWRTVRCDTICIQLLAMTGGSAVQRSHLGLVSEVTITKDDTLMLGGAGPKEHVEARAADIKSQIAETKSDYEKEKLNVCKFAPYGDICLSM